jgi:NADPH-dependent ferric siderophore reductase
VSSTPLSSSINEVVLAGQAALLCGVPGNDVMVQLTNPAGKLVRRRYSVRTRRCRPRPVHPVDHDRPRRAGQQWARDAQPGDDVDIVGPRGKIVVDPQADWHLFMGDITCLSRPTEWPRASRRPGKVAFIVETDHADDAVTTTFDEGIAVTGIFVDRMGAPRTTPRDC